MTADPPSRIPLGPIVRLQVQAEKIKSGKGPRERYTPAEHLTPVQTLLLDNGGVHGITVTGEVVEDVHHRDHPRSRFRGINGISFLAIGHYAKMREHFGEHLTDGIAGESVLVDYDGIMTLEDLAGGLVIGTGDQAVELHIWSVAHPCAPFSRFATRLPDDAKPDRRITEALQFLDDGTRGFYGVLDDVPDRREIHLGDMVYVCRSR